MDVYELLSRTSAMSRRCTRKELDSLTTVVGKVRHHLIDIVQSAGALAERRTTVVGGVLGGFGAMTIGYVVTAFISPLNFALFGPLLAATGIAAGVLYVRLFSIPPDERSGDGRRLIYEENEQIALILRERLKDLPAGAPKYVRDGLWREYLAVAKSLTALASPCRVPVGALGSPSSMTLLTLDVCEPAVPSGVDVAKSDANQQHVEQLAG